MVTLAAAVCSAFRCHSVVVCSTLTPPKNSKAMPNDYDAMKLTQFLSFRVGTGLCPYRRLELTVINSIFRWRPFIRFALHYILNAVSGVQCADSIWNFHSESLKTDFPCHIAFATQKQYFIHSVFSLAVNVMTMRRSKISNWRWIPSEMPHNNRKRQTRVHSQYGRNVVILAPGSQ